MCSWAQFDALVDLFVNNVQPQIVYDPTSEAQNAKEFQQTEMLLQRITTASKGIKKSTDVLEGMQKALEEVEGNLRTVQVIQEIKDIQLRYREESQQAFERAAILEKLDPKEYTEAVGSIHAITLALQGTMSIYDDLLKNNLLSMNTADRLRFLIETRNEAQGYLREMHYVQGRIGRRITLTYWEKLYGERPIGSLERER
jgi:hypothetical protein